MPVEMQPTSVIKASLGIEVGGRVHKYFQNTCYRYMDKYVPYRTGNLRRNVDLSNPKQIVYESPYAHYIYMGEKYVMDNGKSAYYSPTYGFWSDKGKKKHPNGETLTYHTAGTGRYWDKRMWSAEGQDVVKKVQDYVNRGGE